MSDTSNIYKYHFFTVLRFIEKKKNHVDQMVQIRKDIPKLVDLSSGHFSMAESFVSHIETISKYAIEDMVFDLLEFNEIPYVSLPDYDYELSKFTHPLVFGMEKDGVIEGYIFDNGGAHNLHNVEKCFLNGDFEEIEKLNVVRFIECNTEEQRNKWEYFNRTKYKEHADVLQAVSFRDFFNEWFGEKEYKTFEDELIKFREKAIKSIGFDTVLKPTEENIISIIKESEKDIINTDYYEQLKFKLSKKDLMNLRKQYIDNEYYKAMLGNKPYAESFISSEWMLKVNDLSGSLDYTGVVSGYLKSVEQLLKALVKTFEGELFYYDNPYEYSDASFIIEDDDQTDEMLKSLGKLLDIVKNNDKFFVKNDTVKYHTEKYLRDWCDKRNPAFHSIGIKDIELIKEIREEALCIYFLLLGGVDLKPEQREALGGIVPKPDRNDYDDKKFSEWLGFTPLRKIPSNVVSLRYTIMGVTPVDNYKWTIRLLGYDNIINPDKGDLYERMTEKAVYDSGESLRDGYDWEEHSSLEIIEDRLASIIKDYVHVNREFFDQFEEVSISSLRGDTLLS